MLDTPGMRELGLWEADAGVAAALRTSRRWPEHCRFPDCAHAAEPGCAVQAALADGSLDGGRWRSWAKLQRELAREARKDDPHATRGGAQGLDPARAELSARKRHRRTTEPDIAA